MKKKPKLSTFGLILLGLLALPVFPLRAQVPQMINYQGRVAVGTTNFNGSGLFKFALVQGASTTLLWKNDGSVGNTEPAAAVTLSVTKGLYSVLLGDTALANMTAIPNSVFANSDVRLRVWFDDGSTGSQLLTPDQRLATVGYAMVAGTLQTGANVSAGTVTATSVTATSFSGSGAGLTNIPANAVVPVATPGPLSGMVLIPAGAFTMGNSMAADTADITNATSTATTVSAFYMDVNEVTKAQWDSVKTWGASNSYTDLPAGRGKAANHPVQTVSWYDCVKWCNARSEQAGLTPVYYTNDAQTTVYRTGNVNVTNAQANWSVRGFRLPTEAEWEKAARGGLSGQRFPSGNVISQDLANYRGNTSSLAYDFGPNGLNAIGSVGSTGPATSPVRSFAANGYGLYDMAGNVFEWCWDWYGTPYAGGTDPSGPATGSLRVIRGGSWSSTPYHARCAIRFIDSPAGAIDGFGFRAVLSPGQ